MCGIIFHSIKHSIEYKDLIIRNKRRGPDYLSTKNTPAGYFTSTVLHLRGNTLTQQPLENDKGDILCYNGQIFDSFEVITLLPSITTLKGLYLGSR